MALDQSAREDSLSYCKIDFGVGGGGEGEGEGGGGMGDLVCIVSWFDILFFYSTYNGVRFFFQHYTP